MKKMFQFSLPLIVSALALLIALARTGMAAPLVQEPTTFEGDLRVTRDADIDRNLNIDGTLVVDGAITQTGKTTLGGLVLTQQSATVTATFVITPTAPYIVLASNAAYTSSTATPIITTTATAGQVIFVRNDNASDALTIDGTGGTVECKADIVLGFDDVQSFIYNGAVWNCLAGKADNS
jgi:hypothetical protein